jgi:cellulose synthase/poly-beta-1,6-N-acetylglucosamine synthase-like glycosyltransferase
MSATLSVATCVFIALQVYHYLAYPLVLAALAAFERRRPTHEMRTPTVSLVTAAYNEQDVIRDKVENSLALDYQQLEVIVVSDGSTDRTDAILDSYVSRGVRFARLPLRSGKAAALSLASELATGDVLVISDANAAVDRDAIRSLVRAFDDPRIGCVCGNLGVASSTAAASLSRSEGVYWRYEAFLRQGESRLGANVASTGALLGIRRCIFPPLPAGTINDDLYLVLHVLRGGYRSVFAPEARAWRKPSQSAADDAKRRRRIVDGRSEQLLRLGSWPWRSPAAVFTLFSHKFLRLLMPHLMLGALLANVALLLWPPVAPAMQATLAAQLLFYALAAAGYVADRNGWRWRIPALAFYLFAGHAAAFGTFWRRFRGRSTVLWERVAR